MLILKQEIIKIMFPNGMSPTDQCIRIEVNIKPARKPEIKLLREFFGVF